jgi:hypothetical protein
MKKFMLGALALALPILAGGCTLTTALADMHTATDAVVKVSAEANTDIHAVAGAACPVLPTVEQLGAAVNVAQNKYAASADAVAGIACAVLAPQPAATPLPIAAPAAATPAPGG